MLHLVLHRVLWMVPTLLVISIISFAIIELPPGSFVAREEYTPYYDEKKFKSVYLGITGLAFITPDSVYNLGCDYIVSAGYGRFRNDQERYSENLMNIAQHEKEYDVIKTFNPGKHYRGHTLKIYKVK